MKTFAKKFLVLSCCLLMALPQVALARAGGGSSGGASMGSRGSYTYHPVPSYQAAPIQRSVTPQPSPSVAPPMQSPGYAPGYSSGYSSFGSPFFSGLAGGFFGAGLAGMMFGHGGYGYGNTNVVVDPFGSIIGGVLQIALLIGAGWLVMRWLRRRGVVGGYAMRAPDETFQPLAAMPWGAATQQIPASLSITSEDQQAFQQLLEKIQLAWGAADLSHLRQYLTPEMLQYFSEQLSADTSRGLVNRVSDVSLLEGDLAQSWSEAGLDYATVHMRWKAIDFMARLDRQASDTDYVASGDATHPVEAHELWTFARAQTGGHWLLSAIQQVQ